MPQNSIEHIVYESPLITFIAACYRTIGSIEKLATEGIF